MDPLDAAEPERRGDLQIIARAERSLPVIAKQRGPIAEFDLPARQRPIAVLSPVALVRFFTVLRTFPFISALAVLRAFETIRGFPVLCAFALIVARTVRLRPAAVRGRGTARIADPSCGPARNERMKPPSPSRAEASPSSTPTDRDL